MNTATLKLMLRELEFGPSDITDLMAVLGLCRRQVARVLKKAHKDGLLRIATWDRKRGAPIPVYVIRRGTWGDAPRPAPLTAVEKTARYRERKREAYLTYNRDYRRQRRAEQRAQA